MARPSSPDNHAPPVESTPSGDGNPQYVEADTSEHSLSRDEALGGDTLGEEGGPGSKSPPCSSLKRQGPLLEHPPPSKRLAMNKPGQDSGSGDDGLECSQISDTETSAVAVEIPEQPQAGASHDLDQARGTESYRRQVLDQPSSPNLSQPVQETASATSLVKDKDLRISSPLSLELCQAEERAKATADSQQPGSSIPLSELDAGKGSISARLAAVKDTLVIQNVINETVKERINSLESQISSLGSSSAAVSVVLDSMRTLITEHDGLLKAQEQVATECKLRLDAVSAIVEEVRHESEAKYSTMESQFQRQQDVIEGQRCQLEAMATQLPELRRPLPKTPQSIEEQPSNRSSSATVGHASVNGVLRKIITDAEIDLQKHLSGVENLYHSPAFDHTDTAAMEKAANVVAGMRYVLRLIDAARDL